MSRVYWVRHGPTHQKAFTGHRDVPADLSDTAAIARLEAYLPGKARIISSDLIRAIDTAAAIAGPRDFLPHEPELREFDFGDWDGLVFGDVAERWPGLSRSYWETPGDVAPPGGESWNTAAARVSSAIDRYRGDRPLIAVAHFGAILTQVQRALRVSAVEVLAHEIAPLSVTVIDYEAGEVPVINHCP